MPGRRPRRVPGLPDDGDPLARALAQFLEDDQRPCLHALLLDAYSDRPLEETRLGEGDDPFAVCPFFDRDGYLQREGWGNGTWVQGGPRLRAHFPDRPEQAPALNKIRFVRWRRHYHYNLSTHDAWPRRLNRAHAQDLVSTTGVLFHFKLVGALATRPPRRRSGASTTPAAASTPATAPAAASSSPRA